MTKTRKTLVLSVGLAVSVAGSVYASERDREPGSVSEDAAAVASPGKTWTVSKGVGAATRNGQTFQVRADGAVATEEIEKQFGSVARFQFETVTSTTPSSTRNGVTVLANGAIGKFDEQASSSSPQSSIVTVDEMKQRSAWSEANRGGANVLVFANGAILSGMEQVSLEAQHGFSTPSVVKDNVRIYADGAAFSSESASQVR